jgi:uncharacterized protein (DUF2147 family)
MQPKLIALATVAMMWCVTSAAQANENDIVGLWNSPKKDSRVFIYKENNQYYGKVVWGSGTQTKDEKNPDATLRNRDLTGLVILKHFTYDGRGVFLDGTIYDPHNGQTYSCKMTLKNTDQLLIRGYLGISLFGRTETWTKQN